MATRRTAIVTGGASGIGLAITKLLLSSKDTSVLVVDRNAAAAASVISELTAAYGESSVLFQQADVTSFETLKAAFEVAQSTWGRIDLVFPIAGISQVFTSPDGKDPFWGKARLGADKKAVIPDLTVIHVNLIGVLNTIHLAISYFRSQEPDAHGIRGRIVAAGSTASIYPFPNESLYGAAKHGVLGSVRSLGPTLIDEGITINALAPSLIETGIGNKEAFEHLKKVKALTPMQTVLDAVSIFIEPSTKLTGQILECCLDHVAFRTPAPFMNADEAHCMQEIFPVDVMTAAFAIPDEVKARKDVLVV